MTENILTKELKIERDRILEAYRKDKEKWDKERVKLINQITNKKGTVSLKLFLITSGSLIGFIFLLLIAGPQESVNFIKDILLNFSGK